MVVLISWRFITVKKSWSKIVQTAVWLCWGRNTSVSTGKVDASPSTEHTHTYTSLHSHQVVSVLHSSAQSSRSHMHLTRCYASTRVKVAAAAAALAGARSLTSNPTPPLKCSHGHSQQARTVEKFGKLTHKRAPVHGVVKRSNHSLNNREIRQVDTQTSIRSWCSHG